MTDLTKIKDEIPQDIFDFAERRAGSVKQFCAVIEYIDGEIVLRIFAFRHKKHGLLEIKEVIRRQTGSDTELTRNLYFGYMCGWQVVFSLKDCYKSSNGYAVYNDDYYDVWDTWTGKGENISYVLLNPGLLKQTDEFRYCGYSGGDVIEYLNLYRKNKDIEFFGKFGIKPSASLISKAKRDGKFRRFLYENAAEISVYGSRAAIYAYENGISVEEARRICYDKAQTERRVCQYIPSVKGTRLDRKKIERYVMDEIDERFGDYEDYLKAIKYLKYDLNDTKNVFPHDFRRMHDLRINEYHSALAKEDEIKRKTLYKRFGKVAEKYVEWCLDDGRYCTVIPKSPSDLKIEGNSLHHCVGKMGYDKKMADEISLIFFVRKSEAADTSYVTVELDPKKLRVLQAYGDHDSKPCESVMIFINEWVNGLKGE